MAAAQEYCFLWIESWATCSTKSDWAAWVQAIGSLTALAVALWIGGQERRDARSRSTVALANFVPTLAAYLEQLMEKCDERNTIALTLALGSLKAELAKPLDVRIDLLPRDVQAAVSASLVGASQAAQLVQLLLDGKLSPKGYVDVAFVLRDQAERLNPFLKIISFHLDARSTLEPIEIPPVR